MPQTEICKQFDSATSGLAVGIYKLVKTVEFDFYERAKMKIKLKILGCLFALLSAMTFANCSFARDQTVDLKVVKLEDRKWDGGKDCKITFQGENKTTFTFGAFDTKFRIMDNAGQLIQIASFRINAIRPGKISSDFIYADNASCKEISQINVVQVEYCEVNGSFIDSCDQYLFFPPGKIKISR
jgi:hypothetical protein